MRKRFKGEMIVKAAWSLGRNKTKVRTKEYAVGDDLPADGMGEVLAEVMQELRGEVSTPADVTLVVTFR